MQQSVGFADVVAEFNSSGTYNGALGIQEHTVLVVGGGGAGGKWGGGGGGGGGRVFGSFKMTRNESHNVNIGNGANNNSTGANPRGGTGGTSAFGNSNAGGGGGGGGCCGWGGNGGSGSNVGLVTTTSENTYNGRSGGNQINYDRSNSGGSVSPNETNQFGSTYGYGRGGGGGAYNDYPGVNASGGANAGNGSQLCYRW